MMTARAASRPTAPLTPLLLSACIGLTMAACESVTVPLPTSPSPVISAVVSNIYLATFDSLDARAARLQSALDALAASPSDETLAAAQSAWRSARQPYENNEAFAFGPLVTEGFDPQMDTWPIDRAGIDALLAGPAPITQALVDGLDGSLKGFHGVEYLLFGLNGRTTPEALGVRERDYLTSAGASLAAAASRLHDAWAPTGGNFAGQLTTAGQSGSVYPSMGAALQDVVGGLVECTDEVANSKLAGPLTTGSADYEESRFSDNTLADLENDVGGVQLVYLGGVSSLIAAADPATDQLVRQQISAALAALAAVRPSFDAALHHDPALLRSAQQAVLTLNQTLTNRIVPLVGGIADAD
ncbi:MAG TPA: imelysin family protein [Gemmatimonadaceae bacterium]|nr:imelysin family protein [Gemmatimonadaceae bacterium]